MRTSIKSILSLSAKEGAAAKLQAAFSVIDKSVKAGIVHKNNAANKKSQLAKFVNKLA
jgi:small subunit ribosomal protein S20